MYGNKPMPPKHAATLTTRKVGILLRELSDDEDEAPLTVGNETTDRWRDDFDSYLKSKDQLGAMSIIEWWGVCTQIKLVYH
jgi:hypothetical protein